MNIKEPQFRTVECTSEAQLGLYMAQMQAGGLEQYAGKEWTITQIKDNVVTLQELVRARPVGMQYIVVQGRQPQDGSKALEALVIFPAWVSATLMCAGVSGRVIELTDGSIKESGTVPMSEAEVLEGLRADAAADAESQGADCTNEDSWNCKYCRNTENCEAVNSQSAAPEPVAVLSFIDSRGALVDWLLNNGNFTREYLESMENSGLIAMAKDKRLAPGSWQHLVDEPRPAVGRFPDALEKAYEDALNEIAALEADVASLKSQLADVDKALYTIRKTAKKALKGTA